MVYMPCIGLDLLSGQLKSRHAQLGARAKALQSLEISPQGSSGGRHPCEGPPGSYKTMLRPK